MKEPNLHPAQAKTPIFASIQVWIFPVGRKEYSSLS